MSKFYVYILFSDKGHSYIGQSKDLVNRLKRHNANRSKFTANKGPWKIAEMRLLN
ncbi:MAG: GIY-YIG nuclease family protein [Ignavibacteria bacterium]